MFGGFCMISLVGLILIFWYLCACYFKLSRVILILVICITLECLRGFDWFCYFDIYMRVILSWVNWYLFWLYGLILNRGVHLHVWWVLYDILGQINLFLWICKYVWQSDLIFYILVIYESIKWYSILVIWINFE